MTIVLRTICVASVLGGLLSVEAKVQSFAGVCGDTKTPAMEPAVSAQLSKEAKLARNLDATVILALATNESPPTLRSRNKLCPMRYGCGKKLRWDSPQWEKQHSFASCSGVLVAKDVVVTAMHCLCNYGEEDIANLRVHPARWIEYDREDKDWRSVTGVLAPLPAGHAQRCDSCCGDFVFLKLSDGLADPVTSRSSDDRRNHSEESYMISSPFGIPGVLSRGTVRSGETLQCAEHNMYSVWQSSGGAIYSAVDGDFLGIHLKPKNSYCSYPTTNGDGRIVFPQPNLNHPDDLSGEFLELTREVITEHLSKSTWLTPSQWSSSRRGSDCDRVGREKEKGKKSLCSETYDWPC